MTTFTGSEVGREACDEDVQRQMSDVSRRIGNGREAVDTALTAAEREMRTHVASELRGAHETYLELRFAGMEASSSASY